MDLLFMEAFVTDPGFFKIFISKTEDDSSNCSIIHVERSKIDHGLGESDITILYKSDDSIKAILIEDKIDAIAMPEQHARYHLRGKKGIENKEYSQYFVFILCPEHYREINEEAAKYEYFVSYEECKNYFESKDDIYSQIRYQQLEQALKTAKVEYRVDINEIAVDSFQKYRTYQSTYYPRLKSMTKSESGKVNGWWPMYSVGMEEMYIIHKTNFDCVDLTINGAANRLGELQILEKWLHESGHNRITLEKTGKSAAFRIKTPHISMSEPFEMWKMGDLDGCFDAIQELSDLASVFAVINRIIFRK